MELNKKYEFDLGDMSHCGLCHEEMIEHMKKILKHTGYQVT